MVESEQSHTLVAVKEIAQECNVECTERCSPTPLQEAEHDQMLEAFSAQHRRTCCRKKNKRWH
jgi:hypothetical protein